MAGAYREKFCLASVSRGATWLLLTTPSFSQLPHLAVLPCHRAKAVSLFINGNHSIQREIPHHQPSGKCKLKLLRLAVSRWQTTTNASEVVGREEPLSTDLPRETLGQTRANTINIFWDWGVKMGMNFAVVILAVHIDLCAIQVKIDLICKRS